MSDFSLQATVRSVVGNQVRKLRRDGKLPGVIYGQKKDSTNLEVDTLEFNRIYKKAGKTHVVTLKLDKEEIPCLIHDVDEDPVKSFLRHFDLLAVDLKTKIKTQIPVHVVGQSPAAKESGAIVSIILQEIEIEAFPDKIPESIEVDISNLTSLDQVIHVSDLKSKDYDILTDEHETLITLVIAKEDSQEEASEVGTEENHEGTPPEAKTE